LILVVCSLAVALASESQDDLFEAFVTKFNKSYLSNDEKAYRLATFKHNLATIEYHNSMDSGAQYGVNEFSDMSEEEFSQKMLTLHHDHTHGNFPVAPAITTAPPASIDWREKGAVTAVKNQGQCGSCWSFSTTGNVEGQWFLKKGSLTSLSEQNLVDCDTKEDQGCNGGLPSNAYAYIMANGGIDTEASYPYKAVDGTCKFSKANVGAQISNWTSVSTDETQIAAYLAANGPLSIGINAGWMQTYTGGVSDPLFCNPAKLDHGVLIVGYGVDSASGKPFWNIKNSWGPAWGESGYYRIVRGKGKCGLNTMVTSSIV
jgi:cathepsin F